MLTREDPRGFPRRFCLRQAPASGYRRRCVVRNERGVLLERERELETLRDGLDRARAGDGTLLLIEGPAGVGKTELAREARAAAERARMMPLEARGSELEQPFAFGVVRQLLEPVISKERWAGRSVRRRCWSRGAAVRAGRAAAAGADAGFDALHSLYWLVVNIADRAPVLVLVDDCQWADRDSLRFLAYLAQRIEGLPVAMLLAGRPPDAAWRRGGVAVGADGLASIRGRALSAAAERVGRGGAGARAPGRRGGRGVLPRVSYGHRRQPAVPAGAAAGLERRRRRAVGGRGETRCRRSDRPRSAVSSCIGSPRSAPPRPSWRAPSPCSEMTASRRSPAGSRG